MSVPVDDPLGHEHAQLQRQALKGRLAFRKGPQGPFAATMQAAFILRDKMRTDGATDTELNAAMEITIRNAWPQVREWKYLCHTCLDYGLDMRVCLGDATCGREHPHAPHSYGVACWCNAGRRFKAKPPTVDDELAKVGKVSKPTRLGQ